MNVTNLPGDLTELPQYADKNVYNVRITLSEQMLFTPSTGATRYAKRATVEIENPDTGRWKKLKGPLCGTTDSGPGDASYADLLRALASIFELEPTK